MLFEFDEMDFVVIANVCEGWLVEEGANFFLSFHRAFEWDLEGIRESAVEISSYPYWTRSDE